VDEATLTRLRHEYDAVVLAQGASNPARLSVPGADAKGVEDATHFLRRAKLALAMGERRLDDLPAGTHVLVVGAGNTAMDVARSARRLGCAVTAVDWFDRRFASVRDDELEEAEHEGVCIRFNRVVDRFEVDDSGHVAAARLLHTRQRRAEATPKAVARSAVRLEAELVVLATGYRVGGPRPGDAATTLPVRAPAPKRSVPERTLLGSGLPAGSPRVSDLVRRRAYLERRAVEPVAASVWAAGDGLSGPSTVVGSMAQGLAAARSLLAAAEAARAAAAGVAAGMSWEGARAAAEGRASGRGWVRAAARSSWLPRLSVGVGLAVEITGVLLLAMTRDLFPAAILFGAGTGSALAGLYGWVGGWVSAQDS